MKSSMIYLLPKFTAVDILYFKWYSLFWFLEASWLKLMANFVNFYSNLNSISRLKKMINTSSTRVCIEFRLAFESHYAVKSIPFFSSVTSRPTHLYTNRKWTLSQNEVSNEASAKLMEAAMSAEMIYYYDLVFMTEWKNFVSHVVYLNAQ